jgi:hypothetical protein
MAFAFRDEVEYIVKLRPDHVKVAGDDCLRVARMVDSALPSLEKLKGSTQWDNDGSALYEQRLREAGDLAAKLREGYVRAGNALVDYVESHPQARCLYEAGFEAEKKLGALIASIANSQSATVRESLPMHQWNDLRATQGALDWLAELTHHDEIERLRDQAERYFQLAGSYYGQARESEHVARETAVDELGRARRLLPDFLANSANALAIIRNTPGLRAEIYQASSDPNARRPVGVLEEFQVEPDNRDTVNYPHGKAQVFNDLFSDGHQTRIIAAEADLLDGLNMLQLKKFQEIKEYAELAAEERFTNSEDFTDDQADAFRHTYWNAMLTKEFGEEWTAQFTAAHERNPANLAAAEAMDLHNNSIGRSIALANPNASEDLLAELVGQAVADGRTLVIDGSGNLVYSDQIKLENTGKPADVKLPGGPAPTGAGYPE